MEFNEQKYRLLEELQSKVKDKKNKSDVNKSYHLLIHIIEKYSDKQSIIEFYKTGGRKMLNDLPVSLRFIEKVDNLLSSILE